LEVRAKESEKKVEELSTDIEKVYSYQLLEYVHANLRLWMTGTFTELSYNSCLNVISSKMQWGYY